MKKFNVLKAGTNEVIFGLANIGEENAILLTLIPIGEEHWRDAEVGKVIHCRAKNHENEPVDVVRTE